jgi:prepilin-type N-terminal cleavage/methylation domain-containing protein
MKRARGFTLVELMTVVTIMSVIAAVAIMSLRKGRSEYNSDAWANQIRNTAIQARRRAVATGMPFMMEITGASGGLRDRIQWCQVDNTAVPNRCSQNQTVNCASPCGNNGSPCEAGQIVFAGNDAMTDMVADGMDVLDAKGVYVGPPRNALGSGTDQIFFGPKGTVDAAACANILSSTATPGGWTAYVRASNVTSANTQTQKRRRIVLYGITGRPRIIDNW